MVQQWPPLYRLLGGVHGLGSFCFTPATSGDTDTASYALGSPEVTWTSGTATAQAIFQIVTPAGTVSGDKIYGEADDDAGFATLFDDETAAISAGDLIDLQIDDFAFLPFPEGLMYCRFCIRNSADVQISAWSNTVSKTLDLGGAPTFYIYGF